MKLRILAAAAAAAGIAAGGAAQAQTLKIGYLNSLNHPIGKHMVAGWKLGLEHQGWMKDGDKLGGVPTEIVYGDDQAKADVGRRVADKMLASDKVDIIAGIIWSNVLMAVQRPVIRAKRILLVQNAGAGPMFGKRCSKYFITTSWNNDQNAESLGKLVTEAGIKNAYLMAPNYQAGKDNLNGVRRTFKGKIVGESLFKIGARDYQAEITKVRASGAESLIIFAPGPMGIAFLKQWAASGLGKKVKLYTIFTVDWLSLPIVGKEAVGTFHTNYWNVDLDNDANKKMVKDYVAKYGKNPSHFVAQAYDGATLLAHALKANGGKFDDKLKLMKAMRTVKYPSVRGPYGYNVNGAPIQNFYRREVVMQDGKPFIKTTGVVYENYKDSYYKQCPKRNQM